MREISSLKRQKPLKLDYPRIYALESFKLIGVADKMRHTSFDVYFRCSPRGGVEEEQLCHLRSHLTDVISPEMQDRWHWSLEATGVFSVKSVCNLVDDSLLPSVVVPTRWVKVITIKVNVFAWRLRLDSLPSRLNLSLRGVNINSVICPLCSVAVESTSYLFFSCSLAFHVRRKVMHWWYLDDPEIDS
ncbi:RNA-directed DNA polymerase, eukaryota [Tanacetum coccineum]